MTDGKHFRTVDEARRSARIPAAQTVLDEVEQKAVDAWLAYPFADRRLPHHLLPKGLGAPSDEESQSEFPARFQYDGELCYDDCRRQRAALEAGQTEFANRDGLRRAISLRRIASWIHQHPDSPYVDRFLAFGSQQQLAAWNLAPPHDEEVYEDTEEEGYD